MEKPPHPQLFLITKAVRAAIARLFAAFRSLWITFMLAALLTGCVNYDVKIQFETANRGEIIQHIQLGERLQSLGGTVTQEWLSRVEQQTRNLGGRLQRTSIEEVIVEIPFSSSADLEERFNQFFDSVLNAGELAAKDANTPNIQAHLTVAHSNFLLVERNQLKYEVDLRSLGVRSSSGDILVSPAALVELGFSLETPWGARQIKQADTIRPEIQNGGQELIWTLIPGEQNNLEAVFWLPNFLGIGTVVIIFFVLVGRYLRYPQSPQPPQLQSHPPIP